MLITRPEPAATRTAETLRGMGHAVIKSPLMTIEPTGSPMPDGPFSAIAVTSAATFTALSNRQEAAMLQTLPLFVVGEVSADVARRAGWSRETARAATAEKLSVDLLLWLDENRPSEPVLCPGGEHLAFDLAGELRRHGFDARRWIVYRAVAATGFSEPVRQALFDGSIDAVLLYSVRSASIFASAMSDLGPRHRGAFSLCVMSEKVRQALPDDLARRCLVAEKPDEAHMMKLLMQ